MAHRKLDVDIADEDNYVEDDELAVDQPKKSAAEAEADVAAKSSEVRALLSRGDVAGALRRALRDPHFANGHENAKDKNAQLVVELLQSVKASDMANLIKPLSVDEQDILMKFLYRGMASPEVFNSGVLLAWHERLTEAAGLGAIVRVMTDRRTV